MIQLINDISGNIHAKFIDQTTSDSYERVSSTNKIDLNGLADRRERIEKGISHLDVVEDAISIINQDVLFENKFERVKVHIIKKYNDLSKSLAGVELYDSIIEDILAFSSIKNSIELPSELLVIYIFDKCDIFKKE